jgi:hypothetical protein
MKKYLLFTSFLVATSVVVFNACGGKDDPPAPSTAPTGLAGSQSGTAINLQWNSVSGATSYSVFRSNSSSGTFTQIGEPSGTNFSDFSPFTGSNFYKVAAVNSSGQGPQSSSVSVNFTTGGGGGTTPPATPTGLTAKVNGSLVELDWDSDAPSFRVWRSSSSTGTFTQIGTTTNLWFDDSSPLSGNNFYQISAVNSAGESGRSATASVNFTSGGGGGTQTPIATTWVGGGITTMSITVSWTQTSPAPQNWIVQVWRPSSRSWVNHATLPGTTTTLSISPYRDFIIPGPGAIVNGPAGQGPQGIAAETDLVFVRVRGRNGTVLGPARAVAFDAFLGDVYFPVNSFYEQ